MAGPWNGSRSHFKRWSHLSEPKGLPLQDLRTRLVILDHASFDRQTHGGKLAVYFDLLRPQERMVPFILILWAIRPDHDHRKIKATTVITLKDSVGGGLDQALRLDGTRIQLRSRSGGFSCMVINIVKAEPEIELEDPQVRQFSDDFLLHTLVYDCVRQGLQVPGWTKYQERPHA
jgi:hypothetical protein